MGPVIIGKNCIINDDVHVGPNTSIGDNSKLSHCKIKNSIIMENCEINCNVKIKNSIISSNSNISKQKIDQDEKIFLLGEGTKISL
jgi:glucose-1-phosphate thymidylyltransferase